MFAGLRVACVLPAYNEERKIAAAIASVPSYVDHVFVIDDASADATAALARSAGAGRPGFEVVSHPVNRGVGAALVTGYRRALASDADCVVIMAGDGQMDPSDLPSLLAPIAEGRADYVKGNRFLHPDVWTAMPPARIVGNLVLSAATKLTSGYHHVFDSQCGYTAIARRALEAIDLDALWQGYGYPNDLLSRLNVAGMLVQDVRVRPVYGPAWRSGIKLRNALHPIPWVLLRSFGNRLVAQRRNAAAN